MAETAALDVKETLSTEDLSPEKLHEIRREIHCRIDLRSRLEEVVADWGSVGKKLSSENKAEVRKGTAKWLLGYSEEAVGIRTEEIWWVRRDGAELLTTGVPRVE